MIIGLDTETTGLDLRHGAKPFFVTICDEEGIRTYWHWDVDPKTREPEIPDGDIDEIRQVIDDADLIVIQNSKFDVAVLETIGITDFPWPKVWDTLLADHLLSSKSLHNLTNQCLRYLHINIESFEKTLREACIKARAIAKNKLKWSVAKAGMSDLPSAKEETWRFDMWLPRAVAKRLKYPVAHRWHGVLEEYSNMDSEVLVPLYKKQEEEISRRKLRKIFDERMKVLPVVYSMESKGITLSKQRLDTLTDEYREETAIANNRCVNIARSLNYDLVLPKGANNKSLTEFAFKVLELPTAVKTKKLGAPSLNKLAIEHYQATLPENSKPLRFVNALREKRQRDTALSYMDGYRRFMLPVNRFEGWYRLYPSLNPCGTDTLRFSSQNPNEQNISKKEGFNLRYCFGPAPGREWWSCDAQNIELRLPAYEAGETEMIDLFEKPDEPPYYGSNHLLIFDTLHPEKWDRKDPNGLQIAKKKFASTWYQWTKNGNFAVQYGAQEESGTADRAYHVPGAQSIIKQRFKKIAELNARMIQQAEAYGYVETMPDKNVDPERGYPLICTRTNYGRIKPTVPLSYHVQGTAMWWMMKAMIRCHDFLEELSRRKRKSYFITMQVHDELVFDFPYAPNKENMKYIKECMRLMSLGGDDIGVPTPVSCEYHPENWSTAA